VKECPKPIISAFSLVSLEGFFAMKMVGGLERWESVWGKTIDAWHVLDGELRKEVNSFGQVKSFPAGNIILNENKFIQVIPIVLEGSLRVMRTVQQAAKLR